MTLLVRQLYHYITGTYQYESTSYVYSSYINDRVNHSLCQVVNYIQYIIDLSINRIALTNIRVT